MRKESFEQIFSLVASLETQLAELKDKLAELEASEAPAEPAEVETPVETEPIEVETPVEVAVDDDFAVVDIDIADEGLEIIDDLPEDGFFMKPEEVDKPRVVAVPKTARIDTLTNRESWKTDIPGSPVKDIRSAIALNDRVLFINSLFAGDAEKFQLTIQTLNAMGSFDEALAYLIAEHEDWKYGSDLVYRFMMAVRRKLR